MYLLLLYFLSLLYILGWHTCIESRQRRLPIPTRNHKFFSKPSGRGPWKVDTAVQGYGRSANKALCREDETCTEAPLAKLIFGKASFSPAELFPDKTALASLAFRNPFLMLSTISPEVTYQEQGIMLSTSVQKPLAVNLSCGMRGSLPFRFIKTTYPQWQTKPTMTDGSTADVAFMQQTTFNGAPIKDFAFRLDYLSLLPTIYPPIGTIPLVKYQDSNAGNVITIANQKATEDITPTVDAVPLSFPTNVVSLKKDISKSPWAVPISDVSTLPFLPAQGIVPDTIMQARFAEATRYLPLKSLPEIQQQWWVVPSIGTNSASVTNVVDQARVMRTRVEELMSSTDNSVWDFFDQQGISFAPQHNTGFSNATIDFFVRYFPTSYAQLELSAGLLLPTEERLNCPEKLLMYELGNNGHLELRGGAQCAFKAAPWFKTTAGILASYATPRCEQIGATFKGTSVKNIGFGVPALISWGTILLNIDAEALIPLPTGQLRINDFLTVFKKNYTSGIRGGYEYYHKTRDTVCFMQTTARSLDGEYHPLDPIFVARNSDVIAHTLSAELFIDDGEVLYIAGGFKGVVHGANAFKERCWYVRTGLYF